MTSRDEAVVSIRILAVLECVRSSVQDNGRSGSKSGDRLGVHRRVLRADAGGPQASLATGHPGWRGDSFASTALATGISGEGRGATYHRPVRRTIQSTTSHRQANR